MIVDGLRMKSEYFHMMSLTLSENGELEEAQEEIKSNMKVEDVALESSPPHRLSADNCIDLQANGQCGSSGVFDDLLRRVG